MKTIPIEQKRFGITLIGEILVDEIYNRSTGDIVVVFGGSPANIAMNMSELGIPDVRFFGAVGSDYYGRTLLRDLTGKGIDTTNIAITDRSTSIVRINKTELSPIPSFYRSADYEIPFTSELEEAIKNSSILHFSYWPLSKQPAKDTILKAIAVAKRHHVLIGFDPNYHDALLSNDSMRPEEIQELLRHVDVIKPSLDDSERIFGMRLTPEQYLERYIALGIRLIVMTIGKDGLIAHYDGKTYRLPSLANQIIDATGAGDAFISGMYTGILRGESIESILKIGSACSAYNLMRVGGLSYLPPLDVLKEEYHIGD